MFPVFHLHPQSHHRGLCESEPGERCLYTGCFQK